MGYCLATRFVWARSQEKSNGGLEFETEDRRLQGEMTIVFALVDAEGGTNLVAVYERLPPGLSPANNEAGWQMSLSKLAALAEGR